MTQRELVDWARFESLHEPLPDRLFDIHLGMLCSVVINLARSADAQPVMASDFFVIRPPPQPAPDDGLSEVERQMRNWRGDG